MRNKEHSWVKHDECTPEGKPIIPKTIIKYGRKWVHYPNAYSGGHAGRPWAHSNFDHAKNMCLKNSRCRAVTWSPCCHGRRTWEFEHRASARPSYTSRRYRSDKNGNWREQTWIW